MTFTRGSLVRFFWRNFECFDPSSLAAETVCLTPIVLDVQAIASIAILDGSLILLFPTISQKFQYHHFWPRQAVAFIVVVLKPMCHAGLLVLRGWLSGLGCLLLGHKRSPLKNSSKPARSQQWIVEHTTWHEGRTCQDRIYCIWIWVHAIGIYSVLLRVNPC